MWARCVVGESFGVICALAAVPFSASVCLEMVGLELPDVEWATCLSGPKHRNFPLTAEINQSQGKLCSNMRREYVCVSVFICGRMSTFYTCFCASTTNQIPV